MLVFSIEKAEEEKTYFRVSPSFYCSSYLWGLAALSPGPVITLILKLRDIHRIGVRASFYHTSVLHSSDSFSDLVKIKLLLNR